jgi:hypothetical protein
MLKVLLLFISFSALALARGTQAPIGFQDNFWQQVQIQDAQRQQQLQWQDQYRRQLLLQDQKRQIQQLQDQQSEIDRIQQSLIMHQRSDLLKLYSVPVKTRREPVKKKNH